MLSLWIFIKTYTCVHAMADAYVLWGIEEVNRMTFFIDVAGVTVEPGMNAKKGVLLPVLYSIVHTITRPHSVVAS